jgi:hypothetical protein
MRIVCRQLLMLGIISLAVITFFTGINWGLPTRGVDSFLFGDRTPWTGALIMQLAGPWDAGGTRGADIAMHPITNRDRSIALNDTDAKRAEIVRRFRLYSNQPDEMITFRSLARMKPGKLDLDPRLYQYGGLWIYPIGALLKLGSLLHIITLRTDLAFYLDHPEAFGRFYLVARSYSALWGLLGVFAIFVVGREWTGKFFVGATAAAVYAAMPVVINAAHEAKPHLAGTVLTLLTVWAGLRFVRTGRPRWWIIAGIFAGAAMGMVLTGYAAFAVLPAMILLRPMSWKRRIALLIGTGMIGLFVFIATNPYLPYDFLFNRAAIKSNIGNYGTFYRPGVSFSAMSNTARLLIEGMSPALACVGTIAVITYVIALCRRRATVGKHANGPRANCQQFEDRNGSAAPIARLDQTPEAQAIGLLLAADSCPDPIYSARPGQSRRVRALCGDVGRRHCHRCRGIDRAVADETARKDFARRLACRRNTFLWLPIRHQLPSRQSIRFVPATGGDENQPARIAGRRAGGLVRTRAVLHASG